MSHQIAPATGSLDTARPRCQLRHFQPRGPLLEGCLVRLGDALCQFKARFHRSSEFATDRTGNKVVIVAS